VTPLVLDVAQPDQVAKAAQAASDVTLIINNAGFSGRTGVLSTPSLDNARREMEVNYFGSLAILQAFKAAPALQSGGGVINVLSFLALATAPAEGSYSASKAAALALTRTLRAELKPRGVQVMAALPVQVETPLGAGMPEPRLQPTEVASGILDGLEADAEEVFPGSLSQRAAAAFKADPEAIQARLNGLVHEVA